MAFAHHPVCLIRSDVSLCVGIAQEQSGESWQVLTDENELIEASLSADAITQPQEGSDVLLLCTSQSYYILNTLTRPAKTLKLKANTIEINSDELRINARQIMTSAKRIYQEFGTLFQKARSCFLENRHHKIKAETLTEEVTHLHHQKAGVIAQQADVISTQADKVLIN